MTLFCLSTAAEAAEWKVPARYSSQPNPVAPTKASIEAGKRIWIKECADCHGETGKGDGPGAARIERPVTDLHEIAIASQSDGALFFKVKTGRRPMPGYREMLGDEDLWNVVNYMRQLIGRGRPQERSMAKKAEPRGASPEVGSGAGRMYGGAQDVRREPPAEKTTKKAETSTPQEKTIETARPETKLADVTPARTSTKADVALKTTPEIEQPKPTQPAEPATRPEKERAEAHVEAPAEPKSEVLEGVESSIEELRDDLEAAEGALHPGTLKLLIAGTAAANWSYTIPAAPTADTTNLFNATIAPHFYFKIGESLLVESHIDIRLATSASEVNLEFMHIAWMINRWLIVGAGKIVTPFGLYQDRIHTSWINRLPNEPLIVRDPGGIIPKHDIGLTLRGVIDLTIADIEDVTSIDYAFYVSNGPQLVTPAAGAGEMMHFGELMYDSYVDNNKNKAVGGRLGWRIFPPLEIGGSAQYGRVGSSGTIYVDAFALLLGLDLHFASAIEPLGGSVLIEAEYARTSVSLSDYGDYHFSNDRQGAYALLAYSPSTLPIPVIRNLELVGRWDWVKAPEGSPQHTQSGFTVGLNYWLASTVVLKAAYSQTEVAGASTATQQFLTQLAAGL